MYKSTSLDHNEIEKFSKLANQWWDPQGKFKPLHDINPIRIAYLKAEIIRHFNLINSASSLINLKLLDIGCGGGLISEPMCRLGAKVTAIDASKINIEVASLHAKQMNLNINYRTMSVEELALEDQQYDIILNLEVIEHVNNITSFIEGCSKLLKPDGIMIITTINRTIKSYLLAIIGAEYILKWLPIGTHDWQKFIKPAELANYLRPCNLKISKLCGMQYSLLNRGWKINQQLDINYLATVISQ